MGLERLDHLGDFLLVQNGRNGSGNLLEREIFRFRQGGLHGHCDMWYLATALVMDGRLSLSLPALAPYICSLVAAL